MSDKKVTETLPGANSWGSFCGRVYWLQCAGCGFKMPDGTIGRTMADSDFTYSTCCIEPDYHIHSRKDETPHLGPQE